MKAIWAKDGWCGTHGMGRHNIFFRKKSPSLNPVTPDHIPGWEKRKHTTDSRWIRRLGRHQHLGIPRSVRWNPPCPISTHLLRSSWVASSRTGEQVQRGINNKSGKSHLFKVGLGLHFLSSYTFNWLQIQMKYQETKINTLKTEYWSWNLKKKKMFCKHGHGMVLCSFSWSYRSDPGWLA